jgi:hypothetical protein
MKRAGLLLALALLATPALRAQDQHQGPVVYPTNAPADTAPQPDIAPPASPAAPAPAPDATPAPAPSSASPNPALSGLPNLPTAGASGQADDIYDIRPPYFYLKPLTWLWILLGVLAAVALVFALWRWLAPLAARRALTPYEQALERLEKARTMLNEKDPEPYAVFVSETIRNYLGQRFKTPSTRRTTEEFLRQMQADAGTPLLATHRDLLRGFLEACDLVKFAHYQPARDELEQVQQRAVSFVTATRPVEGAPA